MKTGIVRRLDDLNRIVIPKEIVYRLFGTRYAEGQPLEISLEKNGSIMLTPYKPLDEWEPIVNAHGELVEFVCGCGCSSQAASNYCPNCGAKKDNTDIEERIRRKMCCE